MIIKFNGAANMTKSKISWENWNEKEREHLNARSKKNNLNNILSDSFDDDENEAASFTFTSPNIVTPFGVFSQDSMLTPSNRWNCWIGHTNFTLTNKIANKLNKEIEGVAALNILDRYTFVVGVSKQFDWRFVRQDIEKAIEKAIVKESF